MSEPNWISRLAVCSWSLQPASPQELVERVRQTGLTRVQLALDPLRENPGLWRDLPALAGRAGLVFVSGMVGCVGEDYTTMESIRRTGGIVPDGTWEENFRRIRESARVARELHLPLVTFHAGFMPHDRASAAYATLQDRLRLVAGVFEERDIALGLETGQETADELAGFLTDLGCDNVGVNFDPANMILYDKGDPLLALERLAPFLRQCHIKDARRTKVPGTWGEEVPVGQGEVDWAAFFRVLDRLRFSGDCCVEREAGNQRARDVQTAREHLARVLRQGSLGRAGFG